MHEKIKERIGHLVALGTQLRGNEEVEAVIARTAGINPWFTKEFTHTAINAIIYEMLNEQKLTDWLSHYSITDADPAQVVGIIMAGNIPLVGFHDFLCGYILGHPLRIKLSGKDEVLFPFVFDKLCKIDPELAGKSRIVDRLEGYDAVIATGSNNSHRYFEYYFRDKPKVLRKNRNSIAILTGKESDGELDALADDIFMYFGFGCRNVSKIYIPQEYDVTVLFPHFEKYKWMHDHNKYMNNYDYNRTLLLLNKTAHLANEIIMIQESDSIASPVSMLYYQRYENVNLLKGQSVKNQELIQCIVTGDELSNELKMNQVVPFGGSQTPGLSDYADGVDVLSFLLSLKTFK
ncbi:MAG: acyl-CoA reductase [Bacteroidetes bacterium]|nr:acyl-CoA reductase [Bacteroidota bacterium]